MDTCTTYEDSSIANFSLAVVLAVGIIISYLPQYVRIHNKRTSEGLSPSFLLLGSCSALFTFTNIVLVTQKARKCCSELSVFNCINSQINLVQIGLQSVCAVMILVFVLVFTRDSLKQDKEETGKIVAVSKIVAVHGVISLLFIVYGLFVGNLYAIANFNGLMSTLLTLIKYVPQIYTTYSLKHPGTLSVYMMMMQTPGGVLFTYTLINTPGSRWSSWLSYGTAVLLQGVLLSMCVYYIYVYDTKHMEEDVVEHIVEENERESEREELLGE